MHHLNFNGRTNNLYITDDAGSDETLFRWRNGQNGTQNFIKKCLWTQSFGVLQSECLLQEQGNRMISAITIPTQLTKSKSDARKYQNKLPKISRGTSLISGYTKEMLEWYVIQKRCLNGMVSWLAISASPCSPRCKKWHSNRRSYKKIKHFKLPSIGICIRSKVIGQVSSLCFQVATQNCLSKLFLLLQKGYLKFSIFKWLSWSLKKITISSKIILGLWNHSFRFKELNLN